MKETGKTSKKKTTKKKVDWEERIFQATLAFVSNNDSSSYDISVFEIDRCIRKARTVVNAYKREYEKGKFDM